MIDAPYAVFGWTYLGLSVVALIVAVAVRTVWTTTAVAAGPVVTDAYELACLVGGTDRVVAAALAGLTQRGAIRPDDRRRRLVAVQVVGTLAAVDRVVWAAVRANSPAPPGRVCRACRADLAMIGVPLRSAGLVPVTGRAWRVRLVPAIITAAPALLGLTRLAHRLPQHRPVGLLAVICAAPVVVAVLLAAVPVRRTPTGAAAIAAARRKHQWLRSIGFRRAERMRPGEIALAVALFGRTPLQDNSLAWLADLLWPVRSSVGDSTTVDGSIDIPSGGGGGGLGSDPF